MTDDIPCSECAHGRDHWLLPRPAVVWWHRGAHDERLVCKRCYQRLYMRAKRGSRGAEEAD